jgi:hypothetical protein
MREILRTSTSERKEQEKDSGGSAHSEKDSKEIKGEGRLAEVSRSVGRESRKESEGLDTPAGSRGYHVAPWLYAPTCEVRRQRSQAQTAQETWSSLAWMFSPLD